METVSCSLCRGVGRVSAARARGHLRAVEVVRRVDVWWTHAKAVIKDGHAAHEMANTVQIARAALDGLQGRR